MKIVLQCLLLLLCAGASAQNLNPSLTLNPEKPGAGKTFTYSFDLTGTPLAGKTVNAEVLQMKEMGMQAMDVAVSQQGNTLTGAIPVKEGARMLVVNFYTIGEGEKEISQSALVPLYGSDGKPLADCKALMANVLSGNAFLPMGAVKTDLAQALVCFEDEMAANPGSKRKYLPEYIGLKLKLSKGEGHEQLLQQLNDYVATEKNLEPPQLYQLKKVYGRLKNAEGAAKIDAMLKAAQVKNKPSPEQAAIQRIQKEKDAAKAAAMLDAFRAQQLKKDPKAAMPSFYYSIVMSKAVAAGNWKLYDQLAAKMTASGKMMDKQALANAYNNDAWTLSGETLDAKAVNLTKALAISKKSVTLLEDVRDHTSDNDLPEYTTARRFKKDINGSIANNADTYALLLYKNGQYGEALKYQQMATAENDQNGDMNERLVVYLAKAKGTAAAAEKADAMAKEGAASEKVMAILKEAYTAKNGVAAWEAYAVELQKASKDHRQAELRKIMVNYAAPKFTLKDMEGKEISLESLAGKIIVADFWATWCGPCRASFPAMQKAQANFTADPNVKFVFIDTWENAAVAETDKKVKEFITKNKYPFHVLMDYENKVVEGFEVTGIPTKFIIDTKGNVRFKAVGYDSEQKLIDELNGMIELLKEEK
jgi:thiol-disulfide isomerase/thioredoxin